MHQLGGGIPRWVEETLDLGFEYRVSAFGVLLGVSAERGRHDVVVFRHHRARPSSHRLGRPWHWPSGHPSRK